MGSAARDVIVNDGAGVGDRTSACSAGDVDGSAFSACSVRFLFDSIGAQTFVRSLGGPFALLRMKSSGET